MTERIDVLNEEVGHGVTLNVQVCVVCVGGEDVRGLMTMLVERGLTCMEGPSCLPP